jgi:hypothetical protein
MIKCLNCNKETKNPKFCSHLCYSTHKTGKTYEELSPILAKRKTGEYVACTICNKITYRKKFRLIKRGKEIVNWYCSGKCRILGLKRFGSWSKGLTCDSDERVKDNHIKIHSSCCRFPNKAETKLDGILQKAFPNEWKYIGDGKVLIEGYSPDFININGKKQIIEMFGDYWHKGQNLQDRIDLFNKYGYSCIVIWECELADPVLVIQKIKGGK